MAKTKLQKKPIRKLKSSQRKANDTLGDFIRLCPRSAKIARCARYSDCDFCRSPRSAYKIVDIWHVRYRRLNLPAFTKYARSRDFLRLLLWIASKANPSGWAILLHEFSKLPHCGEKYRQACPHQSMAIKFARTASKIARCVAGLRVRLRRPLA